MKRQYEESTARKIVGWSLVVAFLFGLWWFVLPPQLGGRTLFLTTHGTSMQPLLHDGDLAVLRKQPDYKVGDVVEYQSGALGAPLLHRVVDYDPQTKTFTTKGDNNNFQDLDHPTKKQINGKMVSNYAGLGKHTAWLRSLPVRILGATLVGLAVYFALTRKNEKARRHRTNLPNRRITSGSTKPRSAPSATTDNPEPVNASLPKAGDIGRNVSETVRRLAGAGKPLLVSSAVLTLASLLIAIVAFSHPATSKSDGLYIYTLRGAFNYSAPAPGGDLVYRNGQVQTGDTVYLAMVKNLFVTFEADMDALGDYKASSGTIEFDAELKGASGWSHPFVLSPQEAFNGSTGRVTANIDLNQLASTVAQINLLTKVGEGGYSLTLQPVVHIVGTLGGQKIDKIFKPEATFNATGGMLKPPSAATAPGLPNALNSTSSNKDVLSGLSANQGGEVTVPAGTPQALKTFGTTVGVLTLRLASVIGALMGLIGVGVALTQRRREQLRVAEDHPIENLLDRNAEMFVSVAGWGTAGGGAMLIDLPSLEDLVRVAESHNCLVLHERTKDGHEVFVVNHRHLTYRFEANPLKSAENRFGSRPTNEDAGTDHGAV